MEEITDVVLSFVDRCSQYKRMDDLIADFSSSLKKLGFNRFMMTRLPAMNEKNAEPHIIARTWSEEWLTQYRTDNYFWADPVTQFSFGYGRVFTWTEAREQSKRTQIALRIASEAAAIGMVDGIGFPMGDMSAAQAVVSLSSDQVVKLSDSGKALLRMMCVACEVRATELINKPPTSRPLTPREREVLQWIANGKTVQDAADILGLSHPTIAKHLAEAKQKLNSTNVTQAVARGLMTRQIHL